MKTALACPLPARQNGFSLAELIVSIAIATLLVGGLAQVASEALAARNVSLDRDGALLEARFALDRISAAVRASGELILPLADDPNTAAVESRREQSLPPAIGAKTATAVLAVAMSTTLDRDADGKPDADNDGDGLVNEDQGGDRFNSGKNGIDGVDDDGDGQVDEITAFLSSSQDDDEDGAADEDPIDGLDNDKDGRIDEDPSGDMNMDDEPGIAGVDDDDDGQIDEGNGLLQPGELDDDEDGSYDDDWLDVIVFRLDGSNLVERVPDIGASSGDVHTSHVIAANVNHLKFERLTSADAPTQLVAIALTIEGARGETHTLATMVRVGSDQ